MQRKHARKAVQMAIALRQYGGKLAARVAEYAYWQTAWVT